MSEYLYPAPKIRVTRRRSPWQTNTSSTVFWTGRDCQMTTCSWQLVPKPRSGDIKRRRSDEFWTTVWRMWWHQTGGYGDSLQAPTCIQQINEVEVGTLAVDG